jgi:SAM-dependent methyltransferase
MSRSVKDLRARLFASTPRDRDAYHAEIEKRLAPGMTVLDVGCGKGRLNPFPWKRHPEIRVVGIDPDPEAAVNEWVREFHPMRPGEPWPVPDESIDLAICRYVVEHVEDPDAFLADVRRVLRPGGRFLFLTPSRYHPVMLVSSLLPHGLHQAILGRTKRSAGNDVFPTFYRMNSKRDLRACARRHGFSVELLIQRDFQPSDYFDFNLLVFAPHLATYYLGRLLRLDRQLGASLLGVFAKT